MKSQLSNITASWQIIEFPITMCAIWGLKEEFQRNLRSNIVDKVCSLFFLIYMLILDKTVWSYHRLDNTLTWLNHSLTTSPSSFQSTLSFIVKLLNFEIYPFVYSAPQKTLFIFMLPIYEIYTLRHNEFAYTTTD